MIIDFLTTTRADYGALRPIISKTKSSKNIEARLLVTGTHLSNDYGMTINEVMKDNFNIACKIPILSTKESFVGISETMSNALFEFSKFFFESRPDFLFVDGDRYETLAVCIAAVNANIPIIHLGGGTTTEGAADEYYRHSITKLSTFHMTTTETYRRRVIQMGEQPDRVFLVGSTLIDNIFDTKLLNLEELENSINFKLDKPFAVVTFHPVTLENNSALTQLNELFKACKYFRDMKYIFTLSNADNGGKEINEEIIKFAKENDNVICFPSLGSIRYYSALKYSSFIMGNSSSGILEAPSFHIPTINIGDRQKGRIQAQSVINCNPNENEIINSINKAQSSDFIHICKNAINPNGDGHASEKIVSILDNLNKSDIELKKNFYDILY